MLQLPHQTHPKMHRKEQLTIRFPISGSSRHHLPRFGQLSDRVYRVAPKHSPFLTKQATNLCSWIASEMPLCRLPSKNMVGNCVMM
jgi:hypothetical protein